MEKMDKNDIKLHLKHKNCYICEINKNLKTTISWNGENSFRKQTSD